MKLVSLALSLMVFTALAATAQSRSGDNSLSSKQTSKVQTALAELNEFAAFAVTEPAHPDYTKRLAKLGAAVRKATSRLPESEIKTNLSTAIYFYELASNDPQRFLEPTPFSCSNQKPGIYQRLCGEAISRRDLLFKKARLHTDWTKALLNPNGIGRVALGEIEEQRKLDEALELEGIAALMRLESEIVVHASLGDFEAEPKLAQVSFEAFQERLDKTAIEVRRILAWLPRNQVRTELSNALSSYQDGAFWWGRMQQARVVSVSGLAFENRRAPIENAYLETVPYTVVVNWRNAGRSLRRAEILVQ